MDAAGALDECVGADPCFGAGRGITVCSMPGPHDTLFKYVFEQPEHAASALKAFLPPALAREIDWSSLRVERGHFVTEAQRELRSDILFSVQRRGRATFIYVLVEHQSSSDLLMPLRVLGYLVEIWKSYVSSKPGTRRLPPILSVVVHHDDKPWSAATKFSELFDPDDVSVLCDYLPELRLLIEDLARVDEAALWERSLRDLARLALLLLETARHSATLEADLGRWLEAFRRVGSAPNGVAAVAALLKYAMEVGEIDPEAVFQVAHSLGPSVEEDVMTGAQKLIERGIAKGLERGIAKGLEKGIAEGQTQVVLRQMRLKFGELPEAVQARVRSASPDELDRFAERILVAQSLDEVLA